MRIFNKSKKGKRINLKSSDFLGILHLFVFTVELVLIFCVLLIVIKDISVHTPNNRIRETVTNKLSNASNDSITETSDQIERSFRVPVLMYHYVEYIKYENDTIRESLNIEPHIFEEQVKSLKESGYTFITAHELSLVIDGRIPLPKKPVILTFDDGHWDLTTDVLPILKKYNVKITAFIIPGFIGESDFLSEKQMIELKNSNLVNIGSHSMSHTLMTDLDSDRLRYELTESKKILEEKYGLKITAFAYPQGVFNDDVAKSVKESNYSVAFSTIPGITQSSENRYFIYRIRPGRRIGDELISWLNQDQFLAFGE